MNVKDSIILEKSLKNKYLGKFDLLLLGIVLIIIVCVYIIMKFVFSNNGSIVKIEVDKKLYGSYELAIDQKIEIFDDDGNVMNILMIKNGQADMIEATCPDKLCVHQKAIQNSNESIVCLPHRVVVNIEADSKDSLDAIAN